jgi:hypothetical protein
MNNKLVEAVEGKKGSLVDYVTHLSKDSLLVSALLLSRINLILCILEMYTLSLRYSATLSSVIQALLSLQNWHFHSSRHFIPREGITIYFFYFKLLVSPVLFFLTL